VFDGTSVVHLVVNTTRWLPLDIFRLSNRKNTLRERDSCVETNIDSTHSCVTFVEDNVVTHIGFSTIVTYSN